MIHLTFQLQYHLLLTNFKQRIEQNYRNKSYKLYIKSHVAPSACNKTFQNINFVFDSTNIDKSTNF